MVSTDHPRRDVILTFGLSGTPTPIEGGQGGAWLVGESVMKREADLQLQEWTGTMLASIEQVGFRLPPVRRAVDGRWVVDGWGVTGALPGVSSETGAVPWPSVVEAGRAFHAATRELERPGWIFEREDWWARADRAAWGEQDMDVIAPIAPVVDALTCNFAPLGTDQLIHADLTGNLLYEPDSPPGIIDVSPFWRPAEYADGIVVADALCWHGASGDLLRETGVSLAAAARGLAFRVLTTNAIQGELPDRRALERDLKAFRRGLAVLGSEHA